MNRSPFHVYHRARELANFVTGESKLLPAFASSDIKIYPYQIAAALFALRSPFVKGVVLADEGSLGKTYEALLIATQRWYEGRDKQLLILPTNLVQQWTEKIESGFTLPYLLIDNADKFNTYKDIENPFDQDALIVSTYDFAVEKADYIQQIKWDLVILDEASTLSKGYSGDNKTATTLKRATDGAFRLLLTPTPITISIMDIYGLLWFIDDSVLPDEKSFYDRYFRKPENYPELSEWVSQYCFRTLKSQVSDYVNFSNRVPYAVNYELTKEEKILYEKLNSYLALPKKLAYPKMEQYDLTLMYYHTVSSSAQALCRTLDTAIGRIEDGSERELLREIATVAQSVVVSGKMKKLLDILKKSFAHLAQIGAKRKAIIFTDNLTTLAVLKRVLIDNGYDGVLTYSGQNSRDYSIMERFRNDKQIQILVSTDEAAKGLDIEFCSVVVNYDMLYNAVELEQRITRCHRQGQVSDVLVINLFGRDNFSDVRIMELINKRILQFEGIFGLSDDILGNFDREIGDVLSEIRHQDIVKESFSGNLLTHKTINRELVTKTESTIFRSFTKEVSDKIKLTPEYIEDKIAELNEQLWEIVCYYFEDLNLNNLDYHYVIDKIKRTITAPDGDLPELFYYWNGTRNRPYKSLRCYGMATDFKPHQGRITLVSVLGRHLLDEICCEREGSITVDADIERCTIGLYGVEVISRNEVDIAPYYTFIGQTVSGKILLDKECREIMDLPVVGFSEEKSSKSSRTNYNSRIFTGGLTRPCQLDEFVSKDEFIQKRLRERDFALTEQVGTMRRQIAIAKTTLERDAEILRAEINVAEREFAATTDRLSRIKADKRLKMLQNELRRKKDGLFMDRMRLDLLFETQMEEFMREQQLGAKVLRHFLVEIIGG